MNSSFIFTFLGGIALLLYGLSLIREGLEAMAGSRLRSFLNVATRNRFTGLLSGSVLTALIQSSNATTVLLVGFTSVGLLTLSQSIAVILGADIGTTLTVQLIAFDILDWALGIVALGFFVRFSAQTRKVKSLGLSILGFGFIFLSLKILTEGMAPLKDSPIVNELLLSVGSSPIIGILLAAIMTAFFHSSAATIGLALAFSTQGLMPLSSAIPIILGANIGTCASAMIASIGATLEAKRVALAHLLFKVIGVMLLLPFLDYFGKAIAETATGIPRQIANAHTFFNIGIAFLFLPFTGPLARLVSILIPVRREVIDPGQSKYLDTHVLDSPSLALAQATREVIRMSDIVRDMYRDSIRAFQEESIELVEDIEKRDNWVDRLNRDIKLYLTKLSTTSMTDDQSQREVALLTLTGDLETIGDILDRNLMELAKKKIYKGLRFSDRGLEEIKELHHQVGKNFDLVISAFTSQDQELGAQVIRQKTVIRQKERELRAAHIERLREGLPETIETSAIHLDILTNLVRIDHHVTSIAYPIVEPGSDE